MSNSMNQSTEKQQAEVTTPASAGETEEARRATGVSPAEAGAAPPVEPEVEARVTRRQFTAAYKLRILEKAERCTAPGEIGALLRKEGLYSSHLTVWRRQREEGALAKLAPKKRGRKNKPVDSQARRVSELERENERLRHQLEQAATIIDVQKKLSSLLGMPVSQPTTGGMS